jgi:DNA helicase-2/ATP-dependent DNA helicase PcrA
VLWLYREAGLDAAIEDGLMGSGREAEEAQGRRDLREQFLSMCPHERTQANGFHEVSAFLDGILTHATTDKTEPRVTLSTIHSSKGREWDMGWCPGWCEGLLPVCAWDGQDLSQPSTDEVEEERRLAYVAITRFRKRLVLSWYPEMMVNGQRVWTKPSRFYVEVTIATMTEEERLPKPLISTGVFVPT